MSLTQQQERFCQLIAQGKNQTDAYMEAGYKVKDAEVAKSAASRLFANVNIVTRVAELKAAAAQEAQIDLAWLIRESVATYRAASKDGAHGAANAALKTIGVYTAYWNEKSTRENINRNVDDFSDDDLIAHLESPSGAGIAGSQASASKLN